MRTFIALALTLAATVAHANGRAPLTNGVTFKQGNSHTLYVRSTFGLLISPDDGCTFYWLCEDAIGYGGTFDPLYKVASDGSIFATTYTGFRASRDGGCSFTTNTTLPANAWLAALDLGPTGEVWVGTASGGATNDVYASNDNGDTFVSRGLMSPTIWWRSIKVAPSNAQRVYVSGYAVAGSGQALPVAHLERSDNDGSTWTDEPLAGVAYGTTPLLMIDAVDPTNPDIVYLISVGANPPNGDMVYRSTDGGVTLTQVLATTASVSDIVVANATTVLIATQLGGSYSSSDGGATYAPLANAPQLSCLGQAPDGSLIGCGANWVPDYMSVARSTDNGATWTKVWRFVNLFGPLQCPASTVEYGNCAMQQWPTLQQQFATNGPACGPFTGQTDADAMTPTPTAKRSGGCCDAGTSAMPAGVMASTLALWLGRRRRDQAVRDGTGQDEDRAHAARRRRR